MNYYIISTSIRYINMELKKIITNNNVIRYNCSDITMNDLLLEASYVDLFNDEKFIICYDADFKKEDIEKLSNYLEKPTINHLIFISSKKIKEINNLNIIDKSKFSYKEFKPLVIDYINKKKFKIDDDTLFYIMNECLYNFDLILNELDKIMIYYNKPTKILRQDAEKIVSHNVIDNSNKIIGAIINHDIKKVYEIYEDLKRFKIDGYVITTILGKAFINIFYIKQLLKEKKSVKDIASLLNLRDYVVKEYQNYACNLTEEKIKNEIITLAKLDYNLKNGILNADHGILDYFISI